MNGPCEFKFFWFTTEACLIKPGESTCMVQFPGTNHEFSLSQINKAPYTEVAGSGRNFRLNICENMKDACEGQAVCEVEKDNKVTNLGNLNSSEITHMDQHFEISYHGKLKIWKAYWSTKKPKFWEIRNMTRQISVYLLASKLNKFGVSLFWN